MPTAKTKPVHIEVPEFDEDEIPTIPIEVFGEVFTMRQDVNMFTALDIEEDGGQLTKLMISMIVGDDKPRFRRIMGMQHGLNVERLLAVFEGMIQAATGETVPTKPRRASTRTAVKKAAPALSQGS